MAEPGGASCDVLIVGAGLVGLTLARALADSGLQIRLLDRRSLAAQADDPRALALSFGARQLLAPLGAWPEKVATAITSIHISQRHGFGRSLLQAADYRLPALGYVARYGDLAAGLVASQPSLVVHEGCEILSLLPGAEQVDLTLRDAAGEHQLSARLVVHAEGTPTDSASVSTRDYQQQAVVAEVQCQGGHQHHAWERFTSDGPLALLPLGSGYAIVFTVPPAKAKTLLALDDAGFVAAVQQQFGQRLTFTAIGPRTAFPLALRLRRQLTATRQVWIGNTAQTLHPVSGQGFNLGLRDACELAQTLLQHGGDPGTAATLADYAGRRRLDRWGSALFTDGIVRLFSNALPPLNLARGLGLLALDLLPPARHFVAKRMIWGARAWP